MITLHDLIPFRPEPIVLDASFHSNPLAMLLRIEKGRLVTASLPNAF